MPGFCVYITKFHKGFSMNTIQSLIQFFYEGDEDDQETLVALVTEELGESELKTDVQQEVKAYLTQKGAQQCPQQS